MLTFIIPIFAARVCTKPFFSSKVKILISVQGVYESLLEGVKLIILLKNIFIATYSYEMSGRGRMKIKKSSLSTHAHFPRSAMVLSMRL